MLGRIRVLALLIVAMSGLIGCGGGGGSAATSPPPPPPAVDTTAPTVTSTSPGGGAVDVNRLDNITAIFDEALNGATVDAASFSVVDGNGRSVSGIVSLAAATNTATFSPDAPLSLFSSYTVTLSTAITDTAGNPLGSTQVWTFTTADGGWKVAEEIDVGAVFVAQPEIAIDADGNVIAVWLRDDVAGNVDVYANRFSAETGMWAIPELLETGAGPALRAALAMDPGGNAIAIWNQDDLGTGGTDTWATRYDASSNSWDVASQVSDSPDFTQEPAIAMDPDGSAIAVWVRFDGINLDVIAHRYSAPTGVWSASIVLDDGAGATLDPAVVTDDAGNAIVVWEQETALGTALFDVKVSRYTAASDSWSTALALESDAGDAFLPSIDINRSGDAVVVWEQEAVAGTFIYDVRASVYSAAGAVWSAPTIIDNGANDATGSSAVIDAAGNVTVAWQQDDGTGIYNDIFANRRPAAIGNWEMAVQLDNLAGDTNYPRLAAGVDGDSIVVWQQIDAAGSIELFARTFLVANAVWGAEITLPTDPGDAFAPSLEADANGNGIVVWAHNDAANMADIVARRYVAATDTWSVPDILNNGNGDVSPPSLAVDPNGVAIAAWRQLNIAGTIDIFGNRFD